MRYLLAVKAAVALAAGLAITFSQSHNAVVGLLVFGIFAVTYGILTTGFALRFETSKYLREELVVSIASVTLGLLALMNQAAGLQLFATLVGVWALVLAGNDAILGWRARPNSTKSRDHLITAGLAALLAAIQLLAQLDAVSSVGFFGAYLVLSSVHLAISAFSPKV